MREDKCGEEEPENEDENDHNQRHMDDVRGVVRVVVVRERSLFHTHYILKLGVIRFDFRVLGNHFSVSQLEKKFIGISRD